uniref:Uncharacterized protein n=1 Tax=Oryza nivara TaxID=4536 RepID=A0A0E0GHS3_ORYNI
MGLNRAKISGLVSSNKTTKSRGGEDARKEERGGRRWPQEACDDAVVHKNTQRRGENARNSMYPMKHMNIPLGGTVKENKWPWAWPCSKIGSLPNNQNMTHAIHLREKEKSPALTVSIGDK